MSKEYDAASHPRLIEQKQKRKRIIYKRTILSLCFFATLVFGLSFFSAHPKVVISEVNVSGNRVVSASKIENIVRDSIKGRYVYLFKKSNVFIYPKKQIERNIKNEFARINGIEISIDKITKLSVHISERVGSYLWCGEQLNQEDKLNEECFFINDEGYIFDKAPFFSGSIYFKFYSPLVDKEMPPLSNSSLDPEIIKNIFALLDALEKMSFDVTMIDMYNENEYKLFLKRDSIELPYIVFKKDSDIDEILNNLSASMKQEQFVQEVKGKYQALDYIDLRYKNKVVYRHYE